MARAKAASVGHNVNGGLSDEDAAALTTHYQLKILEDQRKVDALMVDLRAARGAVNGHFKRMTADLGFTRKEFEAEVISKLNMTEAEYVASERKRDRLHRLAGLKQGEQIDLLDHLADTVDEELAAEADGYRAGKRADDPTPPSHVAPIMHQAWMKGWHKGQEENAMQLGRAQEILAARVPAQGMEPVDPVEADLDEDEEADELEQARKLAESGWTKPSAEEATFPAE